VNGSVRDYDEEALRQLLATDPRVLEQELDVTLLDDRVVVAGVVPTEERRLAVCEVLAEAVGDLSIEDRTEVARFPPPARPEPIS
jgi:hypothetical protein